MEFYKKIKQKIEEEMNQDEDDDEEEAESVPSSEFREGDAPNKYRSANAEIKLLREENLTLKEHINRNYDVYVKRLEKRKVKIKELEDNTKLILNENEKLAAKLHETEGNSGIGRVGNFFDKPPNFQEIMFTLCY